MPLTNNAAPVVTGPIIINVVEDGPGGWVAPTTNTFDPDLIDLVRATGLPGVLPDGIGWEATFNMFIIDPGHAAFQSLAEGQVTQVIVLFGITDGFVTVPHQLILNVTGMNDLALIGGNASGTVTEDAGPDATGQLTVTDVDNGEAAFVAGTQAGTWGALTIDATGAWSYALNNALAAVQGLAAGQSLTDTLTVSTVDGTTTQVTITIAGADEPVITGTGGADVLTGTGAGETLLGLGGNDRLSGGDGADRLDGGSGADSLYGDAGDDVLIFDATDRVQSGGAGTDTLLVARAITVNLAASDQISGDSGVATGIENVNAAAATAAVVLAGSAGANVLTGGTGADRLTGRAGADVLTGGGGADRFIFAALADSAVAGADVILDFQHGLDRIDLSAIDAISGGRNNAFTFIGAASFGAAGQVRHDAATGLVEADVNGDGLADLALHLAGATGITAADFVL